MKWVVVGIAFGLAVLAVVMVIKQKKVAPDSAPVIVTPTVVAVSPTQGTAFKQMYVEGFISECVAMMGKQNNSVCSCAADKMVAKYTEDQLTKLFLQFHKTEKLPGEVLDAVKACSNK